MLKLRLAACAASLGLACFLFLMALSPGGAAAATSIGQSITLGCPSATATHRTDFANDVDNKPSCSPSPSPSSTKCPCRTSSSSPMMSPQPSSSTKPRNLASSGSVDLPLLCAVAALMLVAGTMTLTRARLRPRSATRRGMPGRHT